MSSSDNPLDNANDLFAAAPPPQSETGVSTEPLASRMRPRTLDEFIGQDHILGPGRLLRRAIAADMLGSLILSGPPGTGKTTLARVIANTTKSEFTSLNAVLGGVKDVRAAIETAQKQRDYYGRRTILFVDEVHRWNKAQQDALLPWVENGTVILIGATTENPFFEVNSALVSRSRIFQLTPLTDDDLYAIARQALEDRERGYGLYDIQIDDSALAHLVNVADGDARSLLNALQLAVETTPDTFPPDGPVHIGLAEAEESIQRRALLYDREGDYHFDTISAFIKSLRGSDPDAALYWMARMIRAGEDPKYLFRRMLISASEDVGLADPHALGVVESAAAAFDRVGLPEGQYHLTHAALYLATAPKSNSTLGYFDAVKAVEEEHRREVPRHLRDDSRDSEGFGHGEGYKYPHAYRDHWVAQAYLPRDLAGRVFYHPSDQGYEAEIGREVERRRELQLAEADDHGDDGEILTFTPERVAAHEAATGTGETQAGGAHAGHAQAGRAGPGREQWEGRSAASSALRAAVRDSLFSAASPPRHARILVYEPGPPVLLWEAMRHAPEGSVVALFERDEDRRRAADRLGLSGESNTATRKDPTAPLLVTGRPSTLHDSTPSGDSNSLGRSAPVSGSAPFNDSAPASGSTRQADAGETPAQSSARSPEQAELSALVEAGFEAVLCDRLLAGGDRFDGEQAACELQAIAKITAAGGTIALAERAPTAGQRLSTLLEERNGPRDIVADLQRAEAQIFAETPAVARRSVEKAFATAGIDLTTSTTRTIEERRRLPRERIERWLAVDNEHGYPPHLGEEQRRRRVQQAVAHTLGETQVTWRRGFHLFVGRVP